VWPLRVVVISERLTFYPGISQRQEPVLVDALGADLAIEGLDKAVVGRLAGPREVEGESILVSPQVKVAGDEFWPVVDTYRLWRFV
jgi:hypothetical protein